MQGDHARFAFVLLLVGCTGVMPGGRQGEGGRGASQDDRHPSDGADADPVGSGAGGESATLPDARLTPRSGVRRLSAAEYDATVRDLLGDTTGQSHLVLPDDTRTPFDNDYTNQASSKTLVEGVELLAVDATTRLLADPARRDRIVGCKPAGAGDEVCLRTLVTGLGLRALRRPLADDEVARYLALGRIGATAGDFYVGVAAVVRALLQHPEFLHRVEIGTPVEGSPGLYRLGDHEVAARLAYLLWGTMPSPALFAAAADRKLTTPADVRAAAAELLADPRARQRIQRFHAMWMGFEEQKHAPELAEAMRAETAALIDRVVFEEKRPWQDLFRLDETYVGDALARHYGLAAPGGAAPRWVKWSDPRRRGLLAQGSFLQVGTKAEDTSPTMRGLFVRRNLFCQPIAPPPPGVNTDEVPKGSGNVVCKKDRYAAHAQGGCKNCHEQIDPIGFGLEAYDKEGRFRDREAAHPECAIDGKGEVLGVGAFSGPAELGRRALEAGLLNACLVEQLHRFTVGRSAFDELDDAYVEVLAARAGKGDFRLSALLLDVVSSPAFLHRREE